ncbi:septum formation inhibitor Maf [Rhizobium sp. R72]|uniref:Maf-like protein n=1 Tax=unclassified Rhizobium TaxID=2613769 RepID=UPI000B531D29|nr:MULTISPECIES: Maf-like protein [unclassified Rhizobium]OWV96675.1 septum formation inhibitor Maf [Rhizobium sp. R693]OWW05314.1 septum formation inhibitor Maf [Rhizobium sp. R72]OWW06371.1 septum formation inhibitor Maf [Rhizobium sp. R711]
MTLKYKLILASGSPRRVDLLNQAGIEPSRLMPMDIDETPKKSEHPRSLARRLSTEKAEAALAAIKGDMMWKGSYILSADTVVAVGRRILGKAEFADEASASLHLLSGRSHWVYTGVCLVTPDRKIRQKIVETKVRFKRLSGFEIENYLASGQWRGKAGAYGIQGLAGSFVQKMVGSYTNVVGLPLYETILLLAGEGFDVHSRWPEG